MGAFLLRLVAPRYHEYGVAAIATAFLFGVGAVANFFQIMATFGLFSDALVISFIILSSVLGIRPAYPLFASFIQQLRRGLRAIWQIPLIWKLIVFLIILMFVRASAWSLLPPEALGDAVALYLALPKTIADTGFLRPIPLYETFVAFGLQAELHYAALIALANGAAAMLFTVPVALAACALLVVLAHAFGMGWRGQLIALAILITSTAFNRYIGDGKTDTFSIAMGLAALYWALRIYSEDSAYPLRLTGIFTGLAIMAKISYLGVLPIMLLVLIVIPWLTRLGSAIVQIKKTLSLGKILVVIGIWGTLTLVPHIVKNTVVFGEPLSPFITSNSSLSTVTNQSADDEDTIRRVLLGYPFFLVYAHAGNIDHLSLLALAFSPLLVTLPRSFWNINNKLYLLSLAGITGFTFWIAYQPVVVHPRYFLIALIPLVLTCAYAADHMFTRVGGKFRMGGVVTTSTLIVLLIAHTDPFSHLTVDILEMSARYVRGELGDCDFELETEDRACHVAQIINAEAEQGARIFLFSPSRYWFRSDLILCSRTIPDMSGLLNVRNIEEAWAYVYDQGFQYVVVNQASAPTILSNNLRIDSLPNWIQAELIYQEGSYIAYRIESMNPSRQPNRVCMLSDTGVWEVVAIQ